MNNDVLAEFGAEVEFQESVHFQACVWETKNLKQELILLFENISLWFYCTEKAQIYTIQQNGVIMNTSSESAFIIYVVFCVYIYRNCKCYR